MSNNSTMSTDTQQCKTVQSYSEQLVDQHRSVVPHQLGTPRRLPGPRPTASAGRWRWRGWRRGIRAGTRMTVAFCWRIVCTLLGVLVVVVQLVLGHIYVIILSNRPHHLPLLHHSRKKKISHRQQGPLQRNSSPLWLWKPARVNPIKIAYNTHRPDGLLHSSRCL